MYQLLKTIFHTIVPRRLFVRIEGGLRQIIYLFYYRGTQLSCNICDANLRTFINLQNGERSCPRCGSLARNRRLYHILTHQNLLANKNILDFSPSRCLFRKLKPDKTILKYLSSDFEDEFLADNAYDITNIPEPDNAFDTIICYHILEHIQDDSKAMTELHRVLNTTGTLLIQTPFDMHATDIYEDASIQTPTERLTHFGQQDHVRIYTVQGLKHRLQQAGLTVTENKYTTLSETEIQYGFSPNETVLFCTKYNENEI